MKNKWQTAKQKSKIYNQLSGTTGTSKNKFLSDDNNPLDSSIITYQISTQLNYQSDQGGLIISPKTFEVTAFRSHNVENSILNKTKLSLSQMSINGNSFNPGLQKAIEQNAKVEFNQIRGMEEKKKNITQNDYNKLLNGEFIINNIDDKLTLSKGNGGKKYRAKQDLSEFM